jgi:hypothetical protein
MNVTVERVSRNFVLVSAACAALLLGAAASASAGTLDQQQTASNTDGALLSTQSLAQTFTAGISGGLDQVDLDLLKAGTSPDVTVEIRDVSAGQPGAAVLATATVPGSSLGTTAAFLPATFATPATVTAGTQYAIVAYSPGVIGNSSGVTYQSGGNLYTGGLMFTSNQPLPPGAPWNDLVNNDLAFKTYVTPPPPPVSTTPPAKKKCKKKKKKHKHSAESAKKKKCKKKRK